MILCARESDLVEPAELRSTAAAVKNWDAVVEMATRHRVAAYVSDRVDREGLILPPRAARALRQAVFLSLAGVMRIDVELRRVVDALAAAGVWTMVLKGPVLARTLYPGPAFRPYADIDLTVSSDREEIAVSALHDQGFVEMSYAAEEARRKCAGHVHEGAAFHRQFASADGQVVIELHTDPLQLGLRPTCEDGRWQRAHAVPGLPGALMLSPEDQVVQLSAHVHKHGFDRLVWMKDLDLLLRAHQSGLKWELVEQVARDEGVLGSVWYSLYLSELLLSTPIPPAVLRRLRPSMSMRLLYRQVWPISRIANLNGFMRRRAVQLHVAESWRGILPGLILMGRRSARARAAVRLCLPS